MNIGVAIVTYNSAQYVERCLASLASEGVDQIVIVDSGSTDGTQKKLIEREQAFEQLSENKGFGYAANRAAGLLNTDYVLFLNPDSFVQLGAIGQAIKTLHEYPDTGILGMLLCDEHGVPEHMAYGSEPTLFSLFARRFVHRTTLPPNSCKVDWVSGGALLVKKALFDQLQGFDERFFLYWEDVDLCRRARLRGATVRIDPLAKVTHVRGGSPLAPHQKRKIYDDSADTYFKKHYPTHIWKIQRFLRGLYRL